MIELIKRHREFFRFCVVGGLNTGIDFTVFAILYAWGVPLLPAHTVSYGCGILNSFWLNRNWTFKEAPGPARAEKGGDLNSLNRDLNSLAKKKSARQMIKFTLLNIVTLILTYELLVWIHAQWNWPMLICRLFAIVASLVINFAGSRLWVFRQPKLRGKLA